MIGHNIEHIPAAEALAMDSKYVYILCPFCGDMHRHTSTELDVLNSRAPSCSGAFPVREPYHIEVTDKTVKKPKIWIKDLELFKPIIRDSKKAAKRRKKEERERKEEEKLHRAIPEIFQALKENDHEATLGWIRLYLQERLSRKVTKAEAITILKELGYEEVGKIWTKKE